MTEDHSTVRSGEGLVGVEPAGFSRRQMAILGAWAIPTVMLTTATPAAAASEITFAALVVRAGSGAWAAWQGTAAQAPGVRFTRSATGSGTLTEAATITFTPSGSGSVSVSALFTVYDGMVVSVPTHVGNTYIFTVPVSLAAGGHKGITIKDNAAANGTYGISFGGGSATMEIRNAGSSSHEVKSPAS